MNPDVIYHDAETGLLFSSFKYTGDDFERDMAAMRANPKVREWWTMTDSYQEVRVRSALARVRVSVRGWGPGREEHNGPT